jgi:hypothetical protein
MASRPGTKRSYVGETPVDAPKRLKLTPEPGVQPVRLIVRPGIPPAIRVGDFRFEAKHSPPDRSPNEVRTPAGVCPKARATALPRAPRPPPGRRPLARPAGRALRLRAGGKHQQQM